MRLSALVGGGGRCCVSIIASAELAAVRLFLLFGGGGGGTGYWEVNVVPRYTTDCARPIRLSFRVRELRVDRGGSLDGLARPSTIKCVLLGLSWQPVSIWVASSAFDRVWISAKSPIENTIRSSAKVEEKEERRKDFGGVCDRKVSLWCESGCR